MVSLFVNCTSCLSVIIGDYRTSCEHRSASSRGILYYLVNFVARSAHKVDSPCAVLAATLLTAGWQWWRGEG